MENGFQDVVLKGMPELHHFLWGEAQSVIVAPL
jgi:hypothetical protein